MTDETITNTAWRLNGGGRGDALPWPPEALSLTPDSILWVHMSYADDPARSWLLQTDLLARPLAQALLDEETRPRVMHHGDGLLLTLRGVNLNPGAEPEDMVSIRIWIEKDRIISTRKRRLKSVTELQNLLKSGHGPCSTGQFLSMLLERMTLNIGEVIEELQDRMAEVEERVIDNAGAETRLNLSDLRRQAIALRRYLGPQREALNRLAAERVPWMSPDDHFHIRETADELIRHIEDLDAVRERAALAHEEVAIRLSEDLNQRMFLLSVVTVIFMPLGFLTGLFGINVGGIPGADNPLGFTFFCLAMCGVIVGIIALFRRKRWL